MSPLENQLARSLASAVSAECKWFKVYRDANNLPAWFQDAAWALLDFEEQRDLEKTRVNY